MISKDFNWLIVNIDTQEKWDKVLDKIWSVSSEYFGRGIITWKGYFANENIENNIGYDIESIITYNWDDYSKKIHQPKIIECDDFLSEENSESLEKIYTGREVWEALVEGKKLRNIDIEEDNYILLQDNGELELFPTPITHSPFTARYQTVLCASKYTEYKEPKQHTHQELEDILGYKFKYVS